MWERIIRITDWFGEYAERFRLVRKFNKAAKKSFVMGEAPTLLEARVTSGDSDFRHSFSKFMGGGFRIKALTGRPLTKNELIEISRVVLDNAFLVRKLISLGWDTLEVHSSGGYVGVKWKLTSYAEITKFLN